MRFLFTVLLFCSPYTILFAQNLTVGSSGMPLRALKGHDEKGSPYLNEQFIKSDVMTLNKTTFPDRAIRYNVVNQKVEYLNDDLVYEIQDSLSSFKITDSTGRRHTFERKIMNKKPYFFEPLAVGKVSLLKRYNAVNRSSEDWYTKKKVVAIVHTVDYYILKGNDLEKFSASKKNILDLFSDKSEQVKTFINNNSEDLKSDDSLKGVFEYYNTLVESK